MTIIFFSRLFHPHIGGVEKHALEISRQLIKKGHLVIVITEQYDKNLKAQEIFQHIEIHRIPIKSQNWFKKFFIWKWMFAHRELIQKSDIVHCHDVFFWYLPFRFLFSQKKVYTTFHGYETKFPPSKKAIVVRKLSELLSLGNICVGDYIEKWYGTKSSYITYGGVENSPELKIKNSTLSKNKKLRILFVGRLDHDMGITLYLDALKELKQRKINYKIVFLGSGIYKAKASKFGKVIQLDHYNNIYHYSGDADFIFASSYLSILEGMRAGRLVFAVYNNFLKEDYLKKSPFAKHIIIENSPINLAQKIAYYYFHTDLVNKKVNKAYTFAITQTWDNVTGIYLKLWNI